MKAVPVALLGVMMLAPLCLAQAPPSLPETDRVRMVEASRLADALGNRVWPGWDKAPFAILLVTPEYEFLMRHPRPSEDFTAIPESTASKQKVWFRKRQFSPNLLATFPAVGGVPTIVIGQAENTAAKTSTRWVITLLHEHFHQLQNAQPGYFAAVESLGLSRGDQTGMWMLNYAFPYTTPEVSNHFSVMSKALAAALQAGPPADFSRKLASYVEARKAFRSLLNADDYKYFAFQTWQEGIARYTEYRIALLAAAEYRPSNEFQALKDYAPFKEAASAILQGIEKELASAKLDEAKRTAFYALGAAEALVLDRAKPGWRTRYFEDAFSLDEHFRSLK